MPTRLEYDDGAFQYFAACMLMIYLIPGVWFAWAAYTAHAKATGPDAVKGRSSLESALLRRRAQRRKLMTPCFVLNLVMLGLAVIWLLVLIPSLINEKGLEQYDPFAILGVPESASDREIKRAYRKLSLIFHPDKQKGSEEQFVRITKAYEALTDEVAKENFRKYGNPDGKQATSVGFGFPSWFTDEENQPYVLAGYIVALVLGVPGAFYLLYLSCRGVEAPRLERQQEMASFAQYTLKDSSVAPFRASKFRVSELVAGAPDLQEEARKAVSGGRIAIERKDLTELGQAVLDRASGAVPMDAAGGLVAAAAAAAASGGEPSLWPTETGEALPLLPRIKVWNPDDEAERARGPPTGEGVQVVHLVRYEGRRPTRESQGMPPSLFVPPLVLERNHALLWAHLLRVPDELPCHARLLRSAAGAASRQRMLMLAEQALVQGAQAAARGGWQRRDQYLGRGAPSMEQASAIRSALKHLRVEAAAGRAPAAGKGGKGGAAGKKVKKRKTAAERTLAKKIREAKARGDHEEAARLEAAGVAGPGGRAGRAAASPSAAAPAGETGYAADRLEGRERLDWADAVADLHDGLDRIKFPAMAQQSPADAVRCLLMAQRVAQALPPGASPLAQIPALAEAGLDVEAIGREAVAAALAKAAAESPADGSDAAASKGGGKGHARRPPAPRRRPDDADDAAPGDIPEDDPASLLRPAWPEWLRLAPRGWFRDGGELEAFVALGPEGRAALLSAHGAVPSVVAQVEAVVASMPRLQLEASATIRRFGAAADGSMKLKTEFDPFAADDAQQAEEVDLVKVDVVMRHANLGLASPAGSAVEDDDDDNEEEDEVDAGDEEDEELQADEEGEEGEVLEEDDGTVTRRSRRPARRRRRRKGIRVAALRKAEAEAASTPTPEPHAPMLDRPLPKGERWALVVCTDRGWVLSTETVWGQSRGLANAVHVVDAPTAGMAVSLPERFLPGPGEHKLLVMAVCLDYAGLDRVLEVGTLRIDVNRKLPRGEKRRADLQRRAREEEEARALERAQSAGDGDSDDDGAEGDAQDSDGGGEDGAGVFDELHTIMRPANQLDDEAEDDIE